MNNIKIFLGKSKWLILESFFIGLLSICLGHILLRNIYYLFSSSSEFYYIFKQINSSKMNTSLLCLFLLIFPSTCGLHKLWNKNQKFHILVIILAIFAFIIILTLSVLITKVNNIMFIDILSSLIPLIKKGVI